MGAERAKSADADPPASAVPTADIPTADIPGPTVTRLATYLHVLRSFSRRGILLASSGELATAAGVNPAILRKDLSYVGANGVRGVGYDVGRLTARISMTLHTDSIHTVALAGAGSLGRALLSHAGFGRGFRVVAMFDADPALAGAVLESGGPQVAPLTDIATVCARAVPTVEIAVIATADDDARLAFDAFVAAGVRQVLNVTPVSLPAESDVVVRQVDLALELQVLAFQASRGPRDDVKEPRGTKRARGHQGNAMGEETVTA
ncbi:MULTISPECIES: redox-sensing transcriptional repressor Rex [Gordonia]|uniref:Redox-sensing transcriptional repressor Rex n=1 Tax=Gordonia terrae TaxID=2055 RepID=A0AAD0KAZ5_9ACTN|nr:MULTISPECIES: redox-sensing transcriptional repressor Rex [Gordonia]VTR09768.1 redox-sensing transcriptional repressor Rex [Clostridioides difficile]ANY25844.1 redox-sensing transcriptional repressor Rex [Gordonia terrae]AWO86579.1 redox-sensing transcriptional repressor Rex [Gordonia terrae]MCG7631689.1 redox-sensing transcriptional repressor Rex [Gordonia sp. McavH-238-E]UPW10252.1 redox-sensing transcriptional repressor Rex [Gordonia terrae]